MKFDNKEDFSRFIKKSLEDGDFYSQIKRFAQDLKYIRSERDYSDWSKWVSLSYPNSVTDEASWLMADKGTYKNWDWMKYGKTYLVTNGSDVPNSRHDKRFLDIEDFSKEGVDGTMPSLFFIYYGNQEGEFMWVALKPHPDGMPLWNMSSNDGQCWVTHYIELNLGNNSFLNWDREPWGNLK